MVAKALSLDSIRTDGGTQMRAELSQEVYLDYRDKWLSGVDFTPVDVFFDGATYWLADGFHRFFGAREAKKKTIPCRVRRGTQRDAILFSVGANWEHGLRRTNADKRKAVESLLADDEWKKWSDRKIAEQAGVGHNFVNEVRRQLSSDDSCHTGQSNGSPRKGRDGKLRRRRRRKPAAVAAPPPVPIPDEPTPDPEPTTETTAPDLVKEFQSLWERCTSIQKQAIRAFVLCE